MTGQFADQLGQVVATDFTNNPGPRDERSSEVWLPCVFRVGEPETYAYVTEHCPDQTYKGLSQLNEHMWRNHAWSTRCDRCETTFRGVSHENIDRTMEQHKSDNCPPKPPRRKRKNELPITGMSKKQEDEWRAWPTTLPRRSPGGSVVVEHWKHMYRIFYKEQDAPDPLEISSRTPRRQRNPGKRQASSSPDGKRPGLRRKPSSSKQPAPGFETEDVAFPTAPAGATRPQPQVQPQYHGFAYLRSQQLHLPDWSQDPLSADSAPPLLGADLGAGAAAAGCGSWVSTPGPGSMVFSDSSIRRGSETLPRPATPLFVRDDPDPAFHSSLPGLDQGGVSVTGHHYDQRWPPVAVTEQYPKKIEFDSSLG